jgi:acetyl-CoA C-acetyltransferase
VWGSVIPNLGYSNIARETWLDAKLDPTVPATTNVMACTTSITAAMEAAAIVWCANADLALLGGSESMTHVQVGFTQPLSDWLRRVSQARGWKRRASVTRERECAT